VRRSADVAWFVHGSSVLLQARHACERRANGVRGRRAVPHPAHRGIPCDQLRIRGGLAARNTCKTIVLWCMSVSRREVLASWMCLPPPMQRPKVVLGIAALVDGKVWRGFVHIPKRQSQGLRMTRGLWNEAEHATIEQAMRPRAFAGDTWAGVRCPDVTHAPAGLQCMVSRAVGYGLAAAWLVDTRSVDLTRPCTYAHRTADGPAQRNPAAHAELAEPDAAV
jgi:hypothetical protein